MGRTAALLTIALLWAGGPAGAEPRIGDPAPALGLPGLGGATVERIPGRITLVDFAATWCGPCHEALAALSAIVRAEAPEVALVVVDVEEPEEVVQRFFARHPLPDGGRVALDAAGEASARWGRHRFPTTFLVDREGVIRFINRGFGPGYATRLRERVRALLPAGRPAPTER